MIWTIIFWIIIITVCAPVLWYAGAICICIFHGGPRLYIPVIITIIYGFIARREIAAYLRFQLEWPWGKIWGTLTAAGIGLFVISFIIVGMIARACATEPRKYYPPE